MRILEPSLEIMNLDRDLARAAMVHLERCGRVCYQSEDFMKDHSYEKFLRMLIEKGHESVLEHVCVSARVICSRGASHQIVRHRIAAYSQESMRFVNYSNPRHGGSISVIKPVHMNTSPRGDLRPYYKWLGAMEEAESRYLELIKMGCKPEEARGVLPQDTKTEIIVTMNLRMWRHVLKTRMSPAAQDEIRALAEMARCQLTELFPPIFSDIEPLNKE